MSCQEITVQILKDSGHRLTPQRLLILTALRHASGHVTAAQIQERVKESYPYIDASTVYRTLSVLKNLRLVSETNVGDGELLYEWLDRDRHHHLVCRDCGKLTLLDNKYLTSLGDEVMTDHGFEADLDHFAIFGLCPKCRVQGTITE